MNWSLLFAGVVLLLVALLDALWTTIAPRGAGPLSRWIARAWWAARLGVHRHRAGGAHRLLAFAGPALLVIAFLTWVGLLWAGWLLVFSAEPGAVVGSTSREPASLAGRVYYVGFVLFTLGTGDYVPVGGMWEVLSAVASLSGLFVVTLAITYVLSVVSAVAAKRHLAGSIHSLGETPTRLVLQAWDGSAGASASSSSRSATTSAGTRGGTWPTPSSTTSTARRRARRRPSSRAHASPRPLSSPPGVR